MSAPKRSRRYRHLDAALFRATAHSGDMLPPFWPGLDDDAEVEQWCAWLVQVWSTAPIAEAVTTASPVLAARVEAVCAGQRPRAGQVRRMVLSLARYVVRMRGRATPFGVFAGVAPLRFDQNVSARWSDGMLARARADARWLAALVAQLESCDALRARLHVRMNDLAFVRGERLVVPWQPHASDPGRTSTAEISVRHNPAVHTIRHAARSPIRAGDLRGKLAAEFPDAPASVIEGMLAELVARGVLITSLRPCATSTDALAHVLGQLHDVEADALEDVAPLVQRLREIQAHLTATSGAEYGFDEPSRWAVGDRMRALSGAVEQPLMVDLALGGTVVLPPQVAAEAENAAEALLRLTPHPAGTRDGGSTTTAS